MSKKVHNLLIGVCLAACSSRTNDSAQLSPASPTAGSPAQGGADAGLAGTSASAMPASGSGGGGAAGEHGTIGSAGVAQAGVAGQSGAAGNAGSSGSGVDVSLNELAAPLHELRLDLPCDHYQDKPCEPQNSAMPERGYLCCYVDQTIERKNRPHVDKELAFGGDSSRTYDVVLRVRGVLENRDYMTQGKKVGDWLLEQPGTELPKPGAIHVFGFTVHDPEKTYYFNSWNDITRPARMISVDYQATLPIRGGAKVRVFEYDDIGKIWANAGKLTVPDLPPYPDAVEGQFIRFDVISVTPRP